MRIVRGLLWLLATSLTVVVVAASLGLYLAATGKSLPVLRALAGRLDQVVEGQRTEQLDLDVRVRPAAGAIDATARLVVRAERAGRQRVYFLLNDGFDVRRVWEEDAQQDRTPLVFYRLWLVTVVELPRALAEGETVRLGIDYAGAPGDGGMAVGRAILDAASVVLDAGALWYPADLQGFFLADVSVTLPSDLTLVHNGNEVSREERGRETQVRWSSPRPVPGLALVAGRYRQWSRTGAERSVRVLLPDGVDLDPERLLGSAESADELFHEAYGPSGFPSVTLFLDRALDRAFNDGTGLIGIPPGRFNRGDYGVGIVAHEVAHNWWGGTVGQRWLRSGTGGEWIVEGFAEFSSWLAVHDQLGEEAAVRARASDAFEPARAGVLAEMSVFDNGLDPSARPTIYYKGAFAVLALQRLVGEDDFFAAARELLQSHRHQLVTDQDVETTFAKFAKADATSFFADWVRGSAHVDLALEPEGDGASVRNLGAAPIAGQLDLWRFPPDGNPERQSVDLEARTPLGNVESLIVDPLVTLPDMDRGNNVLPRLASPRAVARSSRGELMVVTGEPQPWAPVTLSHLDLAGRELHAWTLDRGVLGDPVWSADGTRILAVERDRDGGANSVVFHVTDGSRRTVAHRPDFAGTADGVVVADGNRLILVHDEHTQTLLQRPGFELVAPVVSAGGEQIAYGARSRHGLDLRVVRVDGEDDRLLLAWRPSAVRWEWSPDGSRLFAVLPGDWDWQLWELPIHSGVPRALVREAAAIGRVAVAPDGRRVAFVAAATLDYGHERRAVFVANRESMEVARFDLDGGYAHDVAWLDDSALLVVWSNPITPAQPVRRELRRLVLADGALSAFP